MQQKHFGQSEFHCNGELELKGETKKNFLP